MIETTKSYKASDGSIHPTIESAQITELAILGVSVDMAPLLLQKKDEVISILRLKARKPRSKSTTTKPKTKKNKETTPSSN